MANLTPVKTWTTNEKLTSTDLNTEFSNVYNNVVSLGTVQTITGIKTHTANIIGGVDGTGVDVLLYGDSPGAFSLWDQSADKLILQGATAAGPGALLLSTGELTVVDGDVLGKIDFSAPLEASGTDAILVGASIQAIAQGTFAAALNATDLIFYTGHSEAATEKLRVTSQGEIGIGGANYGTDGQVLTSGGAGAAPAWETPTVGDITGVTAGVGLSGGGTTGALTLALDLSELSAVTPTSGDSFSTLDNDGANEQRTTTDALATLFSGTGLTASSAVIGVDASQTQITAVGTIGTGTWQGTKVASAYLDDDTAHLSGVQTFSGAKTFTGNLIATGDAVVGHTALVFSHDLELHKSAADQYQTFATWSTTDSHGSRINFVKSGNATIGSYTATADNELLGAIRAFGTDSGPTLSDVAMEIAFEQDGAAGATYIPSRIVLKTGTNAAAATEALRIDSAQKIYNRVDDTGFHTGGGDDTRLYFNNTNAVLATAGALILQTNGTTEAMQITAAGDLQMASGGDITQASGDMNLKVAVNRDIIFSDTAEVMRITGGGKVGIGVAAPSQTLAVEGTATTTGDARYTASLTDDTSMAIGVGGGLEFKGSYTGTTATGLAGIWAQKENGTNSNYAGNLHLGTRIHGGDMTEAIVIDSAQKIKNPVDNAGFYTGASDDLRMYHETHAKILNKTGDTWISCPTGSSIGMYSGTAGAFTTPMINSTAGGAVTLYHAGAAKLATASGGVAATGTLSSTAYVTSTSGMYVGIAPGAESEAVHLDSHSNGAGTAALYIGNAAITVSSDYRAKRDIVDYSGSALDVIDKARVVEFDYIPEMIGDTGSGYGPSSRGRYVGTIAQEMKEWAPWAINDGEGDPEGEHIWKAEYDHVVPLLLKGIQELREELNQIKGLLN